MGIFQNYIKPYDIICISETKQNYIDKHEFKGYECFCHTGGGIYGIAILVKNHLFKVLEKCTKNLIGHSRLAFNNHESNIDC